MFCSNVFSQRLCKHTLSGVQHRSRPHTVSQAGHTWSHHLQKPHNHDCTAWCCVWRLMPSVRFRACRSCRKSSYGSFCLSLGVTVDSYSCLDPGIPVNGIRYGQDFSIGSTVSFGCDSGYRLSHEEPLVCEKNHWWSHPLPTCDGKYVRKAYLHCDTVDAEIFFTV